MMEVTGCAGNCGALVSLNQPEVTMRSPEGKWVKVRLCPMCEARMHDYTRKIVKKSRQKQPA